MPAIEYEAPDEIFTLEIKLVDPGAPEVRYLPNGDPGFPAEPPEFEIVEWRMFGVRILPHILVAAGQHNIDRTAITKRLEEIEADAIECATEAFNNGEFAPD